MFIFATEFTNINSINKYKPSNLKTKNEKVFDDWIRSCRIRSLLES